MAHSVALGKRPVHRSSGRRSGRSTSLPQQQFDDLSALSSSLDFEYGVDVGYQLGNFAKHQRALNDLYVESGSSNESASRREQLLRHAGQVSVHNSSMHWPLNADQIPIPNFTLADEIAAIAQRHLSKQQLGTLTRETAATAWMAASHTLSRALAHLGLLPPCTYPAELVRKDAEKAARMNMSESSRKRVESVASKTQLARRKLLTRSLTWRDVLDAVYTTGDARAHRAADRAHERMANLYGIYPEELQLERRTWSVKSWPDIQERAKLVKFARQRADRVATRPTPMEIWEAACAEPTVIGDTTQNLSDGWDKWRWGSGWKAQFPEQSDEILHQVLSWDSEDESEADLNLQSSLYDDDENEESPKTHLSETDSGIGDRDTDTSSSSDIPNPIHTARPADRDSVSMPTDHGDDNENFVTSTSQPEFAKKRQQTDIQSHLPRRSKRRLNSEQSYKL